MKTSASTSCVDCGRSASHQCQNQSAGGDVRELENTVERIFTQNDGNLLLEFTATHDYAAPEIVKKYCNKVIIRYDLLQFRNDRFSRMSSSFNRILSSESASCKPWF